MRLLVLSIHNAATMLPLGPSAIAAGLAILTAAILWPEVPVVTAMALVARGATSATLSRFRGTAAFLPVALAHLAVYGSLYAVFVGAALHSAISRPELSSNVFSRIDLAFSIVPLALAVELVWCELRSGRSAE